MNEMKSRYYFFVALISTLAGVFVRFRTTDLVDVLNSTMCILLLLLSIVIIGSMFIKPSTTFEYMLRRVFVLVLIYAQLKKTMDSDLTQHLPYRNLQYFRALVTVGNGRDDANRIAQELSSMLVMLNCEVVLLCSYADNCPQIVHEVQTTYPNKTSHIQAMYVNMSDLHSVQNFSKSLLARYDRLDYIVHTAKSSDFPIHQYMGHRLLETLLLPLLLKTIPTLAHHNATPAKIVNVLSPAALQGRFPANIATHSLIDKDSIWFITKYASMFCSTFDTLISGCNTPEAIIELATLLYNFEMQYRVDLFVQSQVDSHLSTSSSPSIPSTYRRLVTSSVDVGSVHHTSSPSMLKFVLSYVSKRDAHDGTMVLLHALLKDTYMPASFINSAKNAFDLLDFRHHHFNAHKALYHGTDTKFTVQTSQSRLLGYVPFWFGRTNFISRSSSNSLYSEFKGMSPLAVSRRLSQVLYDMTHDALQAFVPEPKKAGEDTDWMDVLMTLA